MVRNQLCCDCMYSGLQYINAFKVVARSCTRMLFYRDSTSPSPEPENDPVIQIANMVVQQGEKEPFIKNVFTLDDCAAIVGSEVISFDKKKEVELLRVGVELVIILRSQFFTNKSIFEYRL